LQYLGRQYGIEQAMLALVDEHSHPVWIAGRADGSNAIEIQIQEPAQSSEQLPLVVQGQTLGWLIFGKAPDNKTTTEISNLLPIMAAGLLRELKQNHLQKAESSITYLLQSNLDVEAVLPQVLEILSEILGAHTLLVSTRSTSTGELILLAVSGLMKGESTVRLRGDESRISEGMILEQRQPIWIKDLDNRTLEPQPLHQIETARMQEYLAVPLIGHYQPAGILEIFWRDKNEHPIRMHNLLNTITTQIAFALERSALLKDLRRASQDASTLHNTMFESLAHILGLRDHETEAHTQRVSLLTMRLVEHIGIPSENWGAIRRGALLHDIGKLGIPDSILLKPGSLTDMERHMMELHVMYGYNILSSITNARQTLDIVMHHHERWDGTGYPNKLREEQIPLAARLFAVVDVFDALTSDRPYRTAWLQSRALEYLKEQAGRQFDPEMVASFLEIVPDSFEI
jgi:putative nucleotidyltransferase with HDIG domain